MNSMRDSASSMEKSLEKPMPGSDRFSRKLNSEHLNTHNACGVGTVTEAVLHGQ
jgi:hypothetical protein